MADILIRGMEMPKYITRADIGFDAGGNPLCLIYHKDGTEPDIYDIVPLPKGHGRLIDADELCDGLVSNHPVVIYAKNAPTIVPAEGGTDNA